MVADMEEVEVAGTAVQAAGVVPEAVEKAVGVEGGPAPPKPGDTAEAAAESGANAFGGDRGVCIHSPSCSSMSRIGPCWASPPRRSHSGRQGEDGHVFPREVGRGVP